MRRSSSSYSAELIAEYLYLRAAEPQDDAGVFVKSEDFDDSNDWASEWAAAAAESIATPQPEEQGARDHGCGTSTATPAMDTTLPLASRDAQEESGDTKRATPSR